MTNPFEKDGNAVATLKGDSISVNYTFEQKGRLVQALENSGSGGGTPADYNQVKQAVTQNTNNINVLEQDIQAVQATCNTLDDRITNNNNKINALQTSQEEQESRIKEIATNSSNTAQLVAQQASDIAELKNAQNQSNITVQITQGVRLVGQGSIDTGLTMNGNYSFYGKGYTYRNNQSVLVGAYKSNSERTVLKILGLSNKLQSQWAGNAEMANTSVGAIVSGDFNQSFEYYQNKNKLVVRQNSVIELADGGTSTIFNHTIYSGSDAETPIFIFNQTKNGEFNHGVLQEVMIFDENQSLIRHYLPFYENGEIVLREMVSKTNVVLDGGYFELP